MTIVTVFFHQHRALVNYFLGFLFYKQERLYIRSDNFGYISFNGLVKSISEIQLHTVIWYLLFVPFALREIHTVAFDYKISVKGLINDEKNWIEGIEH